METNYYFPQTNQIFMQESAMRYVEWFFNKAGRYPLIAETKKRANAEFKASAISQNTHAHLAKALENVEPVVNNCYPNYISTYYYPATVTGYIANNKKATKTVKVIDGLEYQTYKTEDGLVSTAISENSNNLWVVFGDLKANNSMTLNPQMNKNGLADWPILPGNIVYINKNLSETALKKMVSVFPELASIEGCMFFGETKNISVDVFWRDCEDGTRWGIFLNQGNPIGLGSKASRDAYKASRYQQAQTQGGEFEGKLMAFEIEVPASFSLDWDDTSSCTLNLTKPSKNWPLWLKIRLWNEITSRTHKTSFLQKVLSL